MVTNFLSSLTSRLDSKCVIKWSWKILPRLSLHYLMKHVAPLWVIVSPCRLQYVETRGTFVSFVPQCRLQYVDGIDWQVQFTSGRRLVCLLLASCQPCRTDFTSEPRRCRGTRRSCSTCTAMTISTSMTAHVVWAWNQLQSFSWHCYSSSLLGHLISHYVSHLSVFAHTATAQVVYLAWRCQSGCLHAYFHSHYSLNITDATLIHELLISFCENIEHEPR